MKEMILYLKIIIIKNIFSVLCWILLLRLGKHFYSESSVVIDHLLNLNQTVIAFLDKWVFKIIIINRNCYRKNLKRMPRKQLLNVEVSLAVEFGINTVVQTPSCEQYASFSVDAECEEKTPLWLGHKQSTFTTPQSAAIKPQ